MGLVMFLGGCIAMSRGMSPDGGGAPSTILGLAIFATGLWLFYLGGKAARAKR